MRIGSSRMGPRGDSSAEHGCSARVRWTRPSAVQRESAPRAAHGNLVGDSRPRAP
jgi:hypothetical protein